GRVVDSPDPQRIRRTRVCEGDKGAQYREDCQHAQTATAAMGLAETNDLESYGSFAHRGSREEDEPLAVNGILGQPRGLGQGAITCVLLVTHATPRTRAHRS